jgi:hypothetical protein
MQDNQNYDNIFDDYTYDGSSTNMLTSKRCYYCYLIYDTVHDILLLYRKLIFQKT